jgi:hypothetical protein
MKINRKKLGMEFPPGLHERTKQYAKDRGIKLYAAVEEALELYLQTKQDQPQIIVTAKLSPDQINLLSRLLGPVEGLSDRESQDRAFLLRFIDNMLEK